MKIKSVKIKNILSIEEAELTFDESGLTLVEGWNHDSNRSNGAGKTAIFNAISFALYDKLPRKITASEIVRRGASKGEVECVVEVGGSTWTAIRSRPKGVLFKRDEEQVDITQEEWEKIIKLTYEQFLISMYCSQNTSNRFLMLNDSDKKTFLLQLLDLDRFKDLKKSSDEIVKSLNAELNDVVLKMSTAESKIEAYKESLIDVDELTTQNEQLRQKVAAVLTNIKELELVKKPDLSYYVKADSQIAEKDKAIAAAKATRSMLHTQYRKLNASITEFDMASTCEACGAKVDVSTAKTQHAKHMDSIVTEIASVKDQIDAQDEIIGYENDLKNLKTKLNEKKSKELEEYNFAQNAISEYKQFVAKSNNILESNSVKLSKQSDLLKKINDLDAVLYKAAEVKRKIIHDLEFYKTLSAIYSPTGAQAYVLDSVIDSFNEYVSKYIDLVWPSASYSLLSFKETSKGDVVAKFSESLVIDGKEVSIGSLSGGELRALSLCVDFTVMEIIHNNFGIFTNPVILDEPFDGLDMVGKEIVLELLEKLSRDRSIIVIDHGTELKAMFSKIISVEKRNGISSIKSIS